MKSMDVRIKKIEQAVSAVSKKEARQSGANYYEELRKYVASIPEVWKRELIGYYDYLMASGFSSTWIRTDYRFSSLAEAEALTRFFFGEALAQKVVQEGWITVPECTGIWWLKR